MNQLTRIAPWAEASHAMNPETIALRRAIHREPELGLKTPKTLAKVTAALAGLPLEFKSGPSTTGLIAILEGARPGRTVLLRGDMDALPMPEDTDVEFRSTISGAMHACGHDAHTAMLVSAAKLMCAQRDRLAGRVLFMFQPGEEGWHGARYMIDDGLLDAPAPDAAFAIHIAPNAPAGILSSKAGSAARIRGRDGDRGARPRRPRVDAASGAGPDPRRLRDRDRTANARDAPARCLRSGRRHHCENRRRLDEQRHSGNRATRRYDPLGLGRVARESARRRHPHRREHRPRARRAGARRDHDRIPRHRQRSTRRAVGRTRRDGAVGPASRGRPCRNRSWAQKTSRTFCSAFPARC